MYRQPIAIVRSVEHYQKQKEIDFVEVFRLLGEMQKIANRITKHRKELEASIKNYKETKE